MHRPEIEPGSPAWQASFLRLPLASGAPERPASQQQTSSGQTPRRKAFFTLWARPLEECRTVEDLDQVLDRCTKDWLEKAKEREEVESDDEEGEEEELLLRPVGVPPGEIGVTSLDKCSGSGGIEVPGLLRHC